MLGVFLGNLVKSSSRTRSRSILEKVAAKVAAKTRTRRREVNSSRLAPAPHSSRGEARASVRASSPDPPTAQPLQTGEVLSAHQRHQFIPFFFVLGCQTSSSNSTCDVRHIPAGSFGVCRSRSKGPRGHRRDGCKTPR